MAKKEKADTRFRFLVALAGLIAAVAFFLYFREQGLNPESSFRAWVNEQQFLFLVPTQSEVRPGDIIRVPKPVRDALPQSAFNLFASSARVLGQQHDLFRVSRTSDVTLSDTLEAGMQVGALPSSFGRAKALGATTFELEMKDLQIITVPTLDLQEKINANGAVAAEMRDDEELVVIRSVLRAGSYRYRLKASSGIDLAEKVVSATTGTNLLLGSDQPMVVGYQIDRIRLIPAVGSPAPSTATLVPPANFDEARQSQNDANARLWPVGSTITVGFLGGTDEQKARFRSSLDEWLAHANLKVSFTEPARAQIRVSFEAGASWSYIGTMALKFTDTSQATTNIGSIEHDAMLHEIGHALGLNHEHQNPNAAGVLNLEVMVAGTSWLTPELSEDLFLARSPYPGTRPFDPGSVMSFEMRPEYLRDPSTFRAVSGLSESDRSYIATLYPRGPG